MTEESVQANIDEVGKFRSDATKLSSFSKRRAAVNSSLGVVRVLIGATLDLAITRFTLVEVSAATVRIIGLL